MEGLMRGRGEPGPCPLGRRLETDRGRLEPLRLRRVKRRVVVAVAHSFKYSRSRRVCDRLTGISLPLPSFILRMKLRLNQGTISLILLMFTRCDLCTRQNTAGS